MEKGPLPGMAAAPSVMRIPTVFVYTQLRFVIE
jgi:hypothetical protein